MQGFGSECDAENPVRIDKQASRVAATLELGASERVNFRKKSLNATRHTNWKQERI
jgi:hypothetical protein